MELKETVQIMDIFCMIAMAAILHVSGEYVAQTSYMFGLSEFDGYAVNNFEFLMPIGLSECLMACYARSPTSCLSVFYHATDRACKIGGDVDMGSAPSTKHGLDILWCVLNLDLYDINNLQIN